ncbi:AhpC/TSA family protein [Sphingomonas sp. PP-CC-3A-396]|nr:AhpC/TSA family protein [Sphingomonas sp. PP-CC-3A-396]
MTILRGIMTCAALLAASAAPGPATATTAAVKIGERSPDFELTLIDGSKVRSADLRGQVVVLNF